MKNIATLLVILFTMNGFSQTTKKVGNERRNELVDTEKAINEDSDKFAGAVFYACEELEEIAQNECFNLQLQKHVIKHLEVPPQIDFETGPVRVMVQFDIDKEGKVVNIKTTSKLSSYSALCETEAKRVFNTLPRFKPATSGGKPIVSSYTIPLNFSN
ncbi:energy transducer TonB [Flavobacterium ardleyense]|uniref:Energy transducer TonB n=1 Tax=Flavobacterium ardleyense TaxID=2038737 RepID=A0ABW5Z9E4_9FLAO